MFHLKRRLKRLSYYKWKASYKLLSNSVLKKFICTFLSSTRHPFEGHKILGTKYCVAILKKKKKEKEKGMNNWKFIFPWRKINWHVLQIAKAQLPDLVHYFWKKNYEVDVSSSSWCTHVYTKIFNKKCIQKIYVSEFPIFSALNYYLHVYLWLLEIWTIYLQKEGISKHSGKKIKQLLWTVVACLLKNCWIWNWAWYW